MSGGERIAYGDHDDAFGELWRPRAGQAPVPVVVLVHGGFWRARYRLDLMDGLAGSVAGAGMAAWNVEYRRVGAGGGHPHTLADVAAAVDHLRRLDAPVDLGRVAVVGHSAGGQLAVWAASRHRLAPGTPGAGPAVRPVLAVAQAGVLDLDRAALDHTGGSAVPDLLGGGPDDVPDRYRWSSPVRLVPTGITVVAVHGSDDDTVPPDQSERYVAAGRAAADPAELVVVDGCGHMDLIDPAHPSWALVLDRLRQVLRP